MSLDDKIFEINGKNYKYSCKYLELTDKEVNSTNEERERFLTSFFADARGPDYYDGDPYLTIKYFSEDENGEIIIISTEEGYYCEKVNHLDYLTHLGKLVEKDEQYPKYCPYPVK